MKLERKYASKAQIEYGHSKINLVLYSGLMALIIMAGVVYSTAVEAVDMAIVASCNSCLEFTGVLVVTVIVLIIMEAIDYRYTLKHGCVYYVLKFK